MSFTLCIVALLAPSVALPVAQGKGKEVKAQFVSLHSKNDRAGCIELWRANPGLVLPTIDSDLEGSLKIREGATPDEAKIAELHARALWGAQAAAEATGNPILVDYASSFVGWNAQEQKFFRTGQALFAKGSGALQKGDHAAALSAGRECVDRAAALGDWWGTAMGYGIQGHAHRGLGELEDALLAFSRARMLNHDLGLIGDEYENLTAIVDLCFALEHNVRGRHAAEQGVALARKLGDKNGEAELAKRLK